MARYSGVVALMAIVMLIAACGGSDDPDNGGASDGGGGSDSAERIHSKNLISDFERDQAAADRKYGNKYVTIEAFVDKHDTNDTGTFIRVKSEAFATRFIYCYYDPAQQPDIPGLESGSVVFLNGRVGEFESIILQVFDCSTVTVETSGGGTLSGS